MSVSTSSRLPRSLPALVLLLSLGACGTDSAERAASSAPAATASPLTARAAVITGTVVDARTGAPVAGVPVEGPGGAQAVSDASVSDASGRFTLSGLPVGVTGELVARSEDGAEARNPLRALRAGTLEVVLLLRRP
jgi:hypothetical protein